MVWDGRPRPSCLAGGGHPAHKKYPKTYDTFVTSP
jgi:hypothetical protein